MHNVTVCVTVCVCVDTCVDRVWVPDVWRALVVVAPCAFMAQPQAGSQGSGAMCALFILVLYRVLLAAIAYSYTVSRILQR